jgi:hypothetical protein
MTVRNLLFSLFMLSAGITVSAQQITGNIRQWRAVVQGALVSARHVETGLTRTTTTDHDGNYQQGC